MKLIDKLKEIFKGRESKIRVRGEISGTNHAEIRMTNIIGEPITLETPSSNLKISMQPLTSGASTFFLREGRIDNSHGFLHQHSGSMVFPMENETMSGALLTTLGRHYWVLENNFK